MLLLFFFEPKNTKQQSIELSLTLLCPKKSKRIEQEDEEDEVDEEGDVEGEKQTEQILLTMGMFLSAGHSDV